MERLVNIYYAMTRLFTYVYIRELLLVMISLFNIDSLYFWVEKRQSTFRKILYSNWYGKGIKRRERETGGREGGRK